MKELIKKILRLTFGDYAIYHIYTSDTGTPVPPVNNSSFTVRSLCLDELLASPNAELREQAGYLGAGAHGFGCFEEEVIVGVCFYWHGARYLKRNFWPLGPQEAKLVQIFTLPKMRGRAVAPTLIAYSASVMRELGFHRNYARVWHSNIPSVRAFERAGWKRINTVVQLKPFFLKRPMKIRLRT